MRCYEDALNFIAQKRDQARLRERIDEAFREGRAGDPFEKLLKIPLYPFQREGALFLAKSGRSLLADELMSFLGEMLERPGAKAIVFSQWVRTHELIARRLKKQKWGHVFFHGGVPGPERQKLVHQFKTDPECRLFLSTDAGGVGLNLQNASVVVNMDQPWNPAVIEQRIGRAHRIGREGIVHVINRWTFSLSKNRFSRGSSTAAKMRSSSAVRG